MCCGLDSLNSIPNNFILQNASWNEDLSKGKGFIEAKGMCTPKPSAALYFQRIELCEKIAEIADEFFHLLGDIPERYLNAKSLEAFGDLHYSTHTIEHFLHSFCFLGDLNRLVTEPFFLDPKTKSPMGYLQSAAKICHLVSHFLSTCRFLNELNIIELQQFSCLTNYARGISAAGYALRTIALLWERSQKECNDGHHHHYNQDNHSCQTSQSVNRDDFRIYATGFLFDAMYLVSNLESVPNSLGWLCSKISSIAGIIHAWSIVDRMLETPISFSVSLDLNK